MSNLSILNEKEFELKLFADSTIDENSYPPELNDLYYIYRLIRDRVILSVLEYGCGWSSKAINIALEENFRDFSDLFNSNFIRHPNKWCHLIIDANEGYIEKTLDRFSPKKIKTEAIKAIPTISNTESSPVFYWDYLPNFSPDLIYIDGPDDNQIVGTFRFFKYENSFTPPIFSDLLRLEPFLMPESILLFDGRTSHVRYVQRNFKRNWETYTDPFGDRTVMRLDESPLGPINRTIINTRIEASQLLLSKEKPQMTR